jgi:hypothetical protein
MGMFEETSPDTLKLAAAFENFTDLCLSKFFGFLLMAAIDSWALEKELGTMIRNLSRSINR